MKGRAFTIVELLVVISIIGLLAGMLMPAIGKARDSARVNVSRNNLRQLGIAHKTYASDWSDRQLTLVNDNLGLYGGDISVFNETARDRDLAPHPGMVSGWGYSSGGDYELYGYWSPNGGGAAGTSSHLFQPIDFPGGPGEGNGSGWFRFAICFKPFNSYFNGRTMDPSFFAPKDPRFGRIEQCFEIPGETVVDPPECNGVWPTYCMSPAALFNPQVLSYNKADEVFWKAPWELPTGYKVPSYGQVRYPSLKTHMLEHYWLQSPKGNCNPNFVGCEPFFFNHGFASVPATLFYDGSVRLMSVVEAMSSDRRVAEQSAQDAGLWSRDTTFDEDGYFIDSGYDFAETSYHILTIDGCRGRDTVGE